MDKITELIIAANRFKGDPSKREESLRKIARLISNGDEEFIEKAKNLLSGNGKGKKKNQKDKFL